MRRRRSLPGGPVPGGRGVSARRASSRDEQTKAILDALRRVLRYLRNAAASTHGSTGLSAAQLFVLQRLAEADRALSVNELAERTYADQSTVSVVAQRLEKRGLLARRRSSEDRRRVDLSVTPRGRTLLGRQLRSPQAGLLQGLARLPPASRAALAEHLRELTRAMGLHGAPAPMMFEDEGGPTPRRTRPRRRGSRPA